LTGRVHTSCERCGNIEVSSTDITILPLVAVVENVYRFRCPLCSMWNVKDASPTVVSVLLRAGACVATFDDEITEPQASPLRPITAANLVAFNQELARSPNNPAPTPEQ